MSRRAYPGATLEVMNSGANFAAGKIMRTRCIRMSMPSCTVAQHTFRDTLTKSGI